MSHRGIFDKTHLSLTISEIIKSHAHDYQGVAMGTSAATPFRSFVKTPIFSVSLSTNDSLFEL